MKKLVLISALIAVAVLGCKQRGSAPAPEADDFPDTLAAAKAAKALPEEPVFDIVTNLGTIKVRLYKDTPRHKVNFEKLALAGYYDSLLFHRVINGFMIQAGDPYTRDTAKVEMYGMGGPNYTIPAEMRDADGNPLHRHKKGALAAARRGDVANPFKESSGSQFYIVQNPDNCIHLDGEYTVFGETVAGFNVIDKIASVQRDRYDRPLRDVRILKITPDEEFNKIEKEKELGGPEFAVHSTE
ncbi:MAG: peptidylprolyl isomerase [Bacteroidales bacterium]|nr:peptidylprolyl isomerase [Bacteroidales bacterium]